MALDQGGYLDLTPLDVASDMRRQTVLTLEEMGIGVEYSHHEAAPSQHEIGLRYTDALTMADNAMTYRLVVKEVALANGVYATFMPKPLAGENGSGMHTHQSLFKGDATPSSTPTTSTTSRRSRSRTSAGLLRHAPEMTLVTNQWVNSYKRLVPGYEAPVYLTWARRNRCRPDPRAAVQARQGSVDAHRVPRARPRLQSVPRVRHDARRRPRGHRARVPAAGRRPRTTSFEIGAEERDAPRHRDAARQPERSDRGVRRERLRPRARSATTSSRACSGTRRSSTTPTAATSPTSRRTATWRCCSWSSVVSRQSSVAGRRAIRRGLSHRRASFPGSRDRR